MIDFERRRIRSRIEAALLDVAGRDDSETGRFKAEQLGSLEGTIVEIGPGTGVNLPLYPAGSTVIAIEPNPVMRTRLAASAAELDEPLDLEIRDLRGEAIDVESGTADAVVGTLVLCGVDDPAAVVHEVRRILRPGGRYVVVEHVVAPEGTGSRRAQQLLRRPHRWMFNGCRTDHDAESLLRSFDWADLELSTVDLGRGAAYVRHQIVGVATR